MDAPTRPSHRWTLQCCCSDARSFDFFRHLLLRHFLSALVCPHSFSVMTAEATRPPPQARTRALQYEDVWSHRSTLAQMNCTLANTTNTQLGLLRFNLWTLAASLIMFCFLSMLFKRLHSPSWQRSGWMLTVANSVCPVRMNTITIIMIFMIIHDK